MPTNDPHQADYQLIGPDSAPTAAERGETARCDVKHTEHGQCVRIEGHVHTRHAFRVEEFKPDEDDRTPEQAAADGPTPATEVDAPTSVTVLGPAYPLTLAEQGKEARCEARLEPYGRCALDRGHDEPTTDAVVTTTGTRHAYRGAEPPMRTVEHDSPSTLAERGETDRCNVEHELYGQCIEYHAHFDPQHTYRLPEGVAAAKISSVSYDKLVGEMEQDTPESPEPEVRTTYVAADKRARTAAERGQEPRCIVATNKYGRCILWAGHTHGQVDQYGHLYRVGPGQAEQAKPAQYEIDDIEITRANGEVVAEFKANPEGPWIEPEHKTSFFDSTGTPFASLTPVVTSITGEGISVGGLMPDKASAASLKRSLALVEAWLDDDEQLPLPHTGFGADLYHALRDIVRAAQS